MNNSWNISIFRESSVSEVVFKSSPATTLAFFCRIFLVLCLWISKTKEPRQFNKKIHQSLNFAQIWSLSTMLNLNSINSLSRMVNCAETRTDADLQWLNHKKTQMKELIGFAIIMCKNGVIWSPWHWSSPACLWFPGPLSWQLFRMTDTDWLFYSEQIYTAYMSQCLMEMKSETSWLNVEFDSSSLCFSAQNNCTYGKIA